MPEDGLRNSMVAPAPLHCPDMHCKFSSLVFPQVFLHGSMCLHAFLYACMHFSCVSYVGCTRFDTEDLVYSIDLLAQFKGKFDSVHSSE